jgi:uncharacterized protein YukE
MTTDPALPGILSGAAGRVDTVAQQTRATGAQAQVMAVSAMIGWSGSSATLYGKTCARLGQELTKDATEIAELADALRRAAKSASQRLYWEKQAEEKRQRELAAQRQRALADGK